MRPPDPVAENRFLAISPYLLVEDVAAAARFYCDRLGFALVRLWEDDHDAPFLGLVRRDQVRILLGSRASAEASPVAARQPAAVYIQVEDADALCREFRARGVRIIREPETARYGMREFVIEDGCGYTLCFGHPVPAPP